MITDEEAVYLARRGFTLHDVTLPNNTPRIARTRNQRPGLQGCRDCTVRYRLDVGSALTVCEPRMRTCTHGKAHRWHA